MAQRSNVNRNVKESEALSQRLPSIGSWTPFLICVKLPPLRISAIVISLEGGVARWMDYSESDHDQG